MKPWKFYLMLFIVTILLTILCLPLLTLTIRKFTLSTDAWISGLMGSAYECIIIIISFIIVMKWDDYIWKKTPDEVFPIPLPVNDVFIPNTPCCICNQPAYVYFSDPVNKSYCQTHMNHGVYYKQDPRKRLPVPEELK